MKVFFEYLVVNDEQFTALYIGNCLRIAVLEVTRVVSAPDND